jgi:hypothetical protein
MHPVNSHFFGTDGIAIKFFNGTSTVNGYIVKQLGTDRFVVSDDNGHTLTAYFVQTYAQATSLSQSTNVNPPAGNTVSGPYQMTIPVPFASGSLGYVTHLYATQIDVVNSSGVLSKLDWSLGSVSVDGSTPLESFATAYDAAYTQTYAAGTHGGPTTLAYVSAPPTSGVHSVTTTYSVSVSTTPNVQSNDVGYFYLSTSATVLPTSGGVENTTYLDGTLGFTVSYPSAGTFYGWVVLSDTSYIISSAIIVS